MSNTPDTAPAAPGDRFRFLGLLGIVAVVVVGALRLAACTQAPINTGDIVRNLAHGRLVWSLGPFAACQPLALNRPDLAWIVWPNQPYSYPPVALFFFAAMAGIWPSVFLVKLALTLADGVTAWLVARLTGDRWCGVLTWCAPVLFWWVSGEGEFEGLQSALLMVSLLLLSKRPGVACAFLALAIQTKVTAVFLGPLYLQAFLRGDGVFRRNCLLGFGVAALPSLAMPYLWRYAFAFNAPLYGNEFHWNLFNQALTGSWWWVKGWQQATSWSMLLLLLWAGWRTGRWWEVAPALLLVVAFKTRLQVQPWYWCALVPALAVVPDRGLRRALFVVWCVCDINSWSQFVVGPFGETAKRGYYEYSMFGRIPGL